LPGHFLDMIGLKTPDNIIFIADSLFSEEIINKYHLFFLYDIKSHLETLQKLKNINADTFIPSHSIPTSSIKKLIDINESEVTEIISTILSFCERAVAFNQILSRVCKKYEINLNANQYVLVSSTIKSYLSFLGEKGELEMFFSEGNVFWKKRENI